LAARASDSFAAPASKETNQSIAPLAAALETNDPKDERQLATLTDRLAGSAQRLKSANQQVAVLSSAPGKRVYQGCVAWAKRKGMGVSAPIKIFKDDATNQAADMAANMGTYLCRCMATDIGIDQEITDEAKFEIARQFETRDRMDNQALAVIVGRAAVKCQAQAADDIARQK